MSDPRWRRSAGGVAVAAAALLVLLGGRPSASAAGTLPGFHRDVGSQRGRHALGDE